MVGATGAGAKGGTKDQSPIAVFLRGEFAKLKEAAIKDEQEKLAAQAATWLCPLGQRAETRAVAAATLLCVLALQRMARVATSALQSALA